MTRMCSTLEFSHSGGASHPVITWVLGHICIPKHCGTCSVALAQNCSCEQHYAMFCNSQHSRSLFRRKPLSTPSKHTTRERQQLLTEAQCNGFEACAARWQHLLNLPAESNGSWSDTGST